MKAIQDEILNLVQVILEKLKELQFEFKLQIAALILASI